VLAATEQQSHAAKVIENRQRVQNSNSELASAVARMTTEGMTNADIATVLALSDPQAIRYYRVIGELPPELAAWIESAPARALYELLQAWRKGDKARSVIAAGLERVRAEQSEDGTTELTMTEVQRIIAAATGKHAGSFGAKLAPAQPAPAQPAPAHGGAKAATQVAGAAPKRARAATATAEAAAEEDVDAEHVAKVKAWLADPARPRPLLAV
jgi:hypothetical protein